LEKLGKIWQDNTSVGSSQPTKYVPRVKIRDFKGDINSWRTFFVLRFLLLHWASARCLLLFHVVGFVSCGATFVSTKAC